MALLFLVTAIRLTPFVGAIQLMKPLSDMMFYLGFCLHLVNHFCGLEGRVWLWCWRQTELPWRAGLSPFALGWPGLKQHRVGCISETVLRTQWAEGRSHAAAMSSALTEVVGHALAWCGKTRCWSCCPVGLSRWRMGDWSCTVMINNKGKVSKRSQDVAGNLISGALTFYHIFFLWFFFSREKYFRLIFRSHTEQQHVLWALSPLHFKLIGCAVSLHFPTPGGVWSKVKIVLHCSRTLKIISKMLSYNFWVAINTQESCLFALE